MWIRMTTTVCNAAGVFARGQSYDVGPNVAAALPPDTFAATSAPWDAAKGQNTPADKQLRPRKKRPLKTK